MAGFFYRHFGNRIAIFVLVFDIITLTLEVVWV